MLYCTPETIDPKSNIALVCLPYSGKCNNWSVQTPSCAPPSTPHERSSRELINQANPDV